MKRYIAVALMFLAGNAFSSIGDHMKLTSSAFIQKGRIPSNYTCDGSDISPPLTIQDVPPHAKSLVLIMMDPDVPTYIRKDGLYNHWIVFNIPPNTTTIAEGAEPLGTHGLGTANNLAYKGPCPPDREHRYFFKLYALNIMLDLKEKATRDQIEQAMQGHILDQTELMGVYER